MTDIYILYGAPATGKGTVTQQLPPEHCIGMGRLLRAQNMGKDGNLVSDDYVNSLIKDELSKHTGYVVLDGYPRTPPQVDFLLALPGISIRRVYELTCPDKELMNRLTLRQSCSCGASYHPILKPAHEEGICDKCHQKLFRRPDDKPEIVQKRLDQYHELTAPILKKFGDLVQQVDVSKDFTSAVKLISQSILSEQSGAAVSRRFQNGYEHE